FLAAAAGGIDRRPGAALGLRRGHAAMLVALLDVFRLAFLLVAVLAFVAARHCSSSPVKEVCSKSPLGPNCNNYASLAFGRRRPTAVPPGKSASDASAPRTGPTCSVICAPHAARAGSCAVRSCLRNCGPFRGGSFR